MGFIAPWMNCAITLYTLYPLRNRASTFGKHAARTLALGMESATSRARTKEGDHEVVNRVSSNDKFSKLNFNNFSPPFPSAFFTRFQRNKKKHLALSLDNKQQRSEG